MVMSSLIVHTSQQTTTNKGYQMYKQYIVVIENKNECPMAWRVIETVEALYPSTAEVFAEFAANRWNGKVISVTEKE